jgi:hypothetical protein
MKSQPFLRRWYSALTLMDKELQSERFHELLPMLACGAVGAVARIDRSESGINAPAND